MRNQKGFTLIELLIVVAIIGIIAAIAIPALLRARVSANESAAIGDIRTVLSAEATYQSTNSNLYGAITCLSTPSACISGYPAAAPTFLDTAITATTQKSGYNRGFFGGAAVNPPAACTAGCLDSFCYTASPQNQNQTGVRGFGGDHSGRICFTPAGADPCLGVSSLPVGCTIIQ